MAPAAAAPPLEESVPPEVAAVAPPEPTAPPTPNLPPAPGWRHGKSPCGFRGLPSASTAPSHLLLPEHPTATITAAAPHQLENEEFMSPNNAESLPPRAIPRERENAAPAGRVAVLPSEAGGHTLPAVTAELALQERYFSPKQRAAAADLVGQLRANGFGDERLLNAFARVPRHLFMPGDRGTAAYRNLAEPIGHGQTISQPSMLAVMLAELELAPHHRVLEIGAGSGYAAALLSHLAAQVWSIELLSELANAAATRLRELEFENVQILHGDGNAGLPAQAPFDRILVSAAPREIPSALVAQLATGGRLAIPLGDRQGQRLWIGTKDAHGTFSLTPSIDCLFVPLVDGPAEIKLVQPVK